MDVLGLSIRILVTDATVADCSQAANLTEGLTTQALSADKGDDSDAIVDDERSRGMEPVIPLRRDRKTPLSYDKHLDCLRHLVENAFLRLKWWRSIATRYAKRVSSFLAIGQIRGAFLWASIS